MAEGIPVLESKVKLQDAAIPDFQSAGQNLAKSDTLLSDIGSNIAQTASNAMAEKLGYTAGLNPSGESYPAFTEFDKHFNQTYEAQSAATLGLQAQELFDNAHVEMSKAVRLTPDLIKNVNTQLIAGLDKISSNAPDAVKSKLRYTFMSKLSNQNADYNAKMFEQDRQESKAKQLNYIDINHNSIYESASRGDLNVALEQIKNNAHIIDNALVNKYIDDETARKLKEADKQTYLNGTAVLETNANFNNKSLPDYLKNYAEHKPNNLTQKQYEEKGKTIFQQVNFLETLHAQDQNLKSQQMLNQIALNPDAITQTQWDAFASSVSPERAEKIKFNLIQAVNKKKTDNTSRDFLIQNYDNAEVQASADPKVKDAAFLKQVENVVNNSNKTTVPLRTPAPVSVDDAEVQVASHAGAEIPVFTRTLKNKLGSANPNTVMAGAKQIHALLQNGNGQALKGLSDQDWSMYSATQSLLDSPDPLKAAQDAHNRIYNQDPEIEKLNNQKFQNILNKQNSAGISNDNFALRTFGMDKSDFLNPSLATAYGSNILSKLSNFFSISGDYDEAVKSTKRWVDENYGDTFINGGKFKTLHPIEKYVGFSGRDGVPYIQQDFVNQFNDKMSSIKSKYDKKEVNEYWEAIPIEIETEKPIDILRKRVLHPYTPDIEIPRPEFEKPVNKTLLESLGQATSRERAEFRQPSTEPSKKHGLFFNTFDPIKVKRIKRTASGEKTETFDVVLIGNAFGQYDVGINTEYGMRNLYREAPQLQFATFSPNIEAIQTAFTKNH